jgi:hypothetical protein
MEETKPSGANSNPGEAKDVVARVETSSEKTLSYLLPLLHKLLATAAVGVLPGWVGSSGAGAGPHATDWVSFFYVCIRHARKTSHSNDRAT